MTGKIQFDRVFRARDGHQEWKTLVLNKGETPEQVKLPVGPVLVPLDVWKARRAELFRREHDHGWPLGIWLKVGENISLIVKDLHDLSLIVLHSDDSSRAWQYATASELRGRHGYSGGLHVGKAGAEDSPMAVETVPHFPRASLPNLELLHAA